MKGKIFAIFAVLAVVAMVFGTVSAQVESHKRKQFTPVEGGTVYWSFILDGNAMPLGEGKPTQTTAHIGTFITCDVPPSGVEYFIRIFQSDGTYEHYVLKLDNVQANEHSIVILIHFEQGTLVGRVTRVEKSTTTNPEWTISRTTYTVDNMRGTLRLNGQNVLISNMSGECTYTSWTPTFSSPELGAAV
ncbi:MAG: hypothetical protein AB1485_01900 [Candidatus Thermoplasmatota archaeon]